MRRNPPVERASEGNFARSNLLWQPQETRSAGKDEGFSGREVPNPLERHLPDRQALGCKLYAFS